MEKNTSVAVVVDSACSLPAKVAQEHGLYIVPMQIVLEGKSYRDGLDLETSEFYERLQKSQTLPTTSGPSPATFLETFQHASQRANHILCLTLAARFSSTYESARIAMEMAAKTLPNVRISLMDTDTAAGAEALVALAAARSALEGHALEEVKATAQEVASRVNLIAFVDTLYYLWKGGRVPKVALWTASLFNIKPILELVRGEVRMVARPRTHSRAIERLLAIMGERVGNKKAHVVVIHAHAPDQAEALKARIASGFQCQELFTTEFTPVLGAHIGPGLIGMAFWTE